MDITISLTDVEYKALSHIAIDPQQWVLNAAQARAFAAMEDIFQGEMQRMLNDPTITSIPADKETVIRNANIKTAKEMHEEALAQMAALAPPVPPRT